jgi:hypothetical protein
MQYKTTEKHRQQSSAYYYANREQVIKKNVERHAKSMKRRDWLLKRQYGISLEEYDRMVEEQDGCCNICNRRVDKLVVDHDHVTGKVRALLCNKCNLLIGFAKDNPKVILQATAYLSVFNLWRLVMLPGQPMGNESVGNPMKPGATEPGDPSPDEIKTQLVGLLKQAKQVAQSNGIDWQEVVNSAEAGAPRAPTGPGMGGAGPVPSPRPPMGSDMGGGMGL